MTRNPIPRSAEETIGAMARKYVWWKAVAAEGHSLNRMVDNIMRCGSYDDIRKLESVVTPDVLATVMMDSAPGWFDDRSWDFWRGRLSRSGVKDIHEHRPQRTFAHADLL